MRTVLPGKPQAKLQALCTVQWEDLRLVVREFESSSYVHLELHIANCSS